MAEDQAVEGRVALHLATDFGRLVVRYEYKAETACGGGYIALSEIQFRAVRFQNPKSGFSGRPQALFG
jgi:hypothetical protein